jgi:hypothetical protein
MHNGVEKMFGRIGKGTNGRERMLKLSLFCIKID